MIEFLTDIIKYISDDPLRILYILGGSGGIIYWWDRWRNRPQIRVRLLNEEFNSIDEDTLEITTTFEVENLGDLTSLEPNVEFSGYTPRQEKKNIIQPIVENDRSLPAHTAKIFTLRIRETGKYPFLLLRTYVFKVTRGKGKRIQIWSESGNKIGSLHYVYALFMFKWFGKFKDPTL